jgi:hypothetical protein
VSYIFFVWKCTQGKDIPSQIKGFEIYFNGLAKRDIYKLVLYS